VSDLFDEFVSAVTLASRRDFDALITEGVPARFLWHGASRFGVSPIAPEGDSTYQPIDSGELAYIIPAMPLAAPWERGFPSDDPGDLIAWRLSHPGHWWRRTGALPILNPDAINRAEIMREPLAVHSSPLAWMQAGGNGCVVLDPRANLQLYFGGVQRIAADTVDLGEAIERCLRERPLPMPQIFVKRAA